MEKRAGEREREWLSGETTELVGRAEGRKRGHEKERKDPEDREGGREKGLVREGGCTRHTGRVASRHSKLGPWERGGSRGGSSQFSTAFLCGNRCERDLSPDHAGLNGSPRPSSSSFSSSCSPLSKSEQCARASANTPPQGPSIARGPLESNATLSHRTMTSTWPLSRRRCSSSSVSGSLRRAVPSLGFLRDSPFLNCELCQPSFVSRASSTDRQRIERVCPCASAQSVPRVSAIVSKKHPRGLSTCPPASRSWVRGFLGTSAFGTWSSDYRTDKGMLMAGLLSLELADFETMKSETRLSWGPRQKRDRGVACQRVSTCVAGSISLRVACVETERGLANNRDKCERIAAPRPSVERQSVGEGIAEDRGRG